MNNFSCSFPFIFLIAIFTIFCCTSSRSFKLIYPERDVFGSLSGKYSSGGLMSLQAVASFCTGQCDCLVALGDLMERVCKVCIFLSCF